MAHSRQLGGLWRRCRRPQGTRQQTGGGLTASTLIASPGAAGCRLGPAVPCRACGALPRGRDCGRPLSAVYEDRTRRRWADVGLDVLSGFRMDRLASDPVSIQAGLKGF